MPSCTSKRDVNEASCASPHLSRTIRTPRDDANSPGLDPDRAGSIPPRFAPAIPGLGADEDFVLDPPPEMLCGKDSRGADGCGSGGPPLPRSPSVTCPPTISATDEAFYRQFIRNTMQEELGDLEDFIRVRLQQVQCEMIRQFGIQLYEMHAMLHTQLVNTHQLLKENKALKEEINDLKERIIR